MERTAAILFAVSLAVMTVPATAQATTIEEQNREWIEDKLDLEEQRPIRVQTNDGYEQRTSAWLVDRLAERFTDAGLVMDEDGASLAATASTDLSHNDFPVASPMMLIFEEAVIEGDDDPRRRSLAAAEQRPIECSQGGGETGGHYDQAHATPEDVRGEHWERYDVPDLSPMQPVDGYSWQGAGVYDYVGTASSNMSHHGYAEVYTFAPTLDATVGEQRFTYDTAFTYEDTTVQYSGSSDFWCIQWEDSRSGDFHVLNAPFVNGVVHQIPSQP